MADHRDPDAAPRSKSPARWREADGRFKQGIKATDDYGVTAARVTIALDMARSTAAMA
jgi:hypothetical protein